LIGCFLDTSCLLLASGRKLSPVNGCKINHSAYLIYVCMAPAPTHPAEFATLTGQTLPLILRYIQCGILSINLFCSNHRSTFSGQGMGGQSQSLHIMMMLASGHTHLSPHITCNLSPHITCNVTSTCHVQRQFHRSHSYLNPVCHVQPQFQKSKRRSV